MASLRAGHQLARRLTSKRTAFRVPATCVAACRNSPLQQRNTHTAPPSRTTRTQLPGEQDPKLIEQTQTNHNAQKRTQGIWSKFDLTGKVFVVTGGARGLGLTMAEGLCEAGGKGELIF